MSPPGHRPAWADDESEMFRATAAKFVREEFVPRQARWQERRRPDAEAWPAAGRVGLLLADIPEEYGGGGGGFAHECVVIEELARAGVHFGSGIQSIVAHYLLAHGDEAQKRRWLPRMARGELIAAIAMTEPNAGSDLQAIQTKVRREGEHYVIDGSKSFVTNGCHAGLVCVAARTDSGAPGTAGISLVLVETADAPGFGRGEPLEKIGMHGQDTCELFFDGVRVPASNLLGQREGMGFVQLMEQLPYERISIALNAVATMERALDITVRHAKERAVFGKRLIEFQNARFTLAECSTEARIARVFVDDCIERFVAGELDQTTAAMAKYWLTECQGRVVDACLQMHGGYGYTMESPIARIWADSRAQRIHAGTTEIMKEIIGWSL